MTEKQKAINYRNDATVIFRRNLTEKNIKIIPKDFEGDIIVLGDLKIDQKLELHGSLYVTGNIKATDDIMVKGDLYCNGEIDACNLTVCGYLYCEDGIDACETNIGDGCYCGYIDVRNINIGGDLICTGENFCALNISVYERIIFKAQTLISCHEIRAGSMSAENGRLNLQIINPEN